MLLINSFYCQSALQLGPVAVCFGRMGDVFGFIGGVFLGHLRHLLIPFDGTVVAESKGLSPEVLSPFHFEWHAQCVCAFIFLTEGLVFFCTHKDPMHVAQGRGEQQL